MTVRKAATFGLNGGKRAACAAVGVVVPPRRNPSPALCDGGSIWPSGGPYAAVADVGVARSALRDPASFAIQGEALQQLALKASKARAEVGAGAAGSRLGPRAAQGFVKVQNEPETIERRECCSGQQGGEGARQHCVPAAKEGCPPAQPLRGAMVAAPTGNAVIEKKRPMTTTWSGLPRQGGAEKGEKRPARRRVWPVAPSVPASPREAVRAKPGEGATLVMRDTKGDMDQRATIRLDLGGELFKLGRRKDAEQAQRRHLIQHVIRLCAALGRVLPQTGRRLETDGPGAVIAFCKRAPRRHGYGASAWTTRTSCRSGRSAATGTSPFERRSIAMAMSVVTPTPDSRRLTWPFEPRPRRVPSSAWDQPFDFLQDLSDMTREFPHEKL